MSNVSRRDFLRTSAVGALGAAMAGMLSGCNSASSSTAASSSAAGIYTPGTYSATSKGISSDVTVTMTFDGNSITDVQIDVSGETAGFGADAGDELTGQLIAAQSAEIDGVSGSTITSDAVKDAAANCIAQAKGEPVISITPGQTAKTSGWRAAPEAVTKFDGEFTADVVIVGGGQAGTPAARAAVEAGASVIVVESQAEDSMSFRGGGQIGHLNSKFLASKGIPTIDINEFVTDWQLRTNNRSRCGLIMAYAKNSGKCFDWMTDSFSDAEKATWSVRQWPLSKNYTQKKSGISTWVGTPTLNGDASPVKRCMEIARAKGADYHFGVKGCQLIKDGDRVVGVVGQDADGKYIKFTANKGVILCGGGFGGNSEMCRDLLIEITDYCSEDTRIGGMDDDGSGIQMGYWVGGRLESRPLSSMGGNYVYPCNSPGDPIGTTAALWVNCHGKRYCNEGFGDIVLAAMAGAKEPQGKIFTVFNDTIREDITYQAPGHMAINYAGGEDEGLDTIMQGAIDAGDAGYEVTGMSTTTVYAGKDAEELGTRMGFTGQDLQNFIATVERYNELCAKGVDEDFAKEPVLMRPLTGKHIFAYGTDKSFGSMLVTTGGLLTDDNSQVLGEDFEPIPGLFAAGNNCGGRFGFQYSTSIPGESLGIANTQGMLVGQYVASL
ncbi:MAG: FAD-dependent oxidoreductase [Faecalibacterium sp.]